MSIYGKHRIILIYIILDTHLLKSRNLVQLLNFWNGKINSWVRLLRIVDPQSRSGIMAWESAMEGAVAACLGNAAVGFLAQTVFGFNLANEGKAGPEEHNAEALGKAGVEQKKWLLVFRDFSLIFRGGIYCFFCFARGLGLYFSSSLDLLPCFLHHSALGLSLWSKALRRRKRKMSGTTWWSLVFRFWS